MSILFTGKFHVTCKAFFVLFCFLFWFGWFWVFFFPFGLFFLVGGITFSWFLLFTKSVTERPWLKEYSVILNDSLSSLPRKSCKILVEMLLFCSYLIREQFWKHISDKFFSSKLLYASDCEVFSFYWVKWQCGINGLKDKRFRHENSRL